MSISEKLKEEEHFYKCLKSFHDYESIMESRILCYEKMLFRIATHQQSLIMSTYLNRCFMMKLALKKNASVARFLAIDSEFMIDCESAYEPFKLPPTNNYFFNQVKAVLRQMYREWSIQGTFERNFTFQPILIALNNFLPPNTVSSQIFSNLNNYKEIDRIESKIKVLIPGYGLGRLLVEVAARGYSVTGIEKSYHMFIASKKIIESLKCSFSFTIYPWVDSTCNRLSIDDLLYACQIPDRQAIDLSNIDFQDILLHCGNFLGYSKLTRERYDCVITSFFLDTARNLIDYIEEISNILVQDGIWINIGPLQYHYSQNLGDGLSIELTYDEIRKVILGYNFDFIDQSFHVYTPYLSTNKSMDICFYKSVYFVVKKK